MKTGGRNGFVMILVIAVIALVGVTMFVLTDDSNTMLFQSDSAYLRATQRNLIASGLVWARHNVKSEQVQDINEPFELDVGSLNARGASTLSVTMDARSPREPKVQINTSCTLKRRTFTSAETYNPTP